MKLNWKLWPLAFAAATFVGCTEDVLDENPNGNGNETIGEQAKVKVIVNAELTTRASADSEDGDDQEKGSYDESVVKDLTVFLFSDGDGNTENGITLTKTSAIVAKGYTSNMGETTGSNHPDNHGWEAEVTVEVTPGASITLAGNSYGVLAVTNIGGETLKDAENTATVGALANYLQTSIHTENFGFVMSTHMLKDESNHESVVDFPAAGETQTVPTVEVFVERLAAKVRINPDTSNDYTFTLNDNSGDMVTLSQAAVLNQLSSGSYLLKRVTNTESTELTIGASASDADDVLLGDEKYTGGTTGANFVIDPWTRKKDGTTVFTDTYSWPAGAGSISTTLSYSNHLMATGDDKSLGAWFEALPTGSSFVDTQKKAKDLTGDDPITLAYTMENTTNVANSLNGFSTGVLFKATYYAKNLTELSENNKGVESSEDKWTGEEPSATTFYTYGMEQIKFDSFETIFAYTLAQQVDDPTGSGSTGYYFYDSFMTDDEGNSTTWDAIKVADFKASKTYTENSVADPFGYIQYLKDNLESVNDETTTMGTAKEKEESSTDLKTFAEFIKDKTAADFKGIKSYVNGECYYFYWIRHENNNNNQAIGPMEFAIVRNNIYDLTVTSISGLGLSAIDVPDPEDPDESDKLYMNVVVKVKDWVVRNNGNIEL